MEMSVFSELGRRELMGLGLGMAGAAMLPKMAFAQKQVNMLAAYYGALTNTAPVAVGMNKGFYNTSNVQVTEVVSTIGGGTAIRNMVGGGLSERRSLRVIGMSASALRYEPVDDRNCALKEKIIALAQRRSRYGAGMIYLKLRQAGESAAVAVMQDDFFRRMRIATRANSERLAAPLQ